MQAKSQKSENFGLRQAKILKREEEELLCEDARSDVIKNSRVGNDDFGIQKLLVKCFTQKKNEIESIPKQGDDGDFGILRFKSGGVVEKTHHSFLNPFHVPQRNKSSSKKSGSTPEFDDRTNRQVFSFQKMRKNRRNIVSVDYNDPSRYLFEFYSHKRFEGFKNKCLKYTQSNKQNLSLLNDFNKKSSNQKRK